MVQEIDPKTFETNKLVTKYSLSNLRRFRFLYWHGDNKIRNLFIDFIFVVAVCTLMYGPVSYLIHLEEKSYRKMSYSLGFLTSFGFALYSVFHIKIFLHGPVDQCFTLILNNPYIDPNHLEFFTRRLKLEKLNRIVSYSSIIIFGFGFFATMFVNCREAEDPYVCGYLLPTYIPMIEPPIPLLYRVVPNFFYTIFVLYVVIPIYDCFLLLATVLTYIRVSFDEGTIKLRSLQFITKWGSRHKLLADIYRLEQRTIECWSRFMIFYTWLMLLQFICASLIIGMLFICVVNAFEYFLLPILFCYLLGEFIFGAVGEYLLNLNEMYRNEIYYSCPWDGDVYTAKFLMLMHLNNIDENIRFPIGEYHAYSNAIALDVVKMAYSILMLYVNTAQ